MPHQNIRLDLVLSDSGQDCVDLSPIENSDLGRGPNFTESPSSFVLMFYDLQIRVGTRRSCFRPQDFKRRRPVGEGDRGRGGDNMLRIRHEIVDGSPDNCHRGTRVSIYLPPVLESHRQERAAMAREVAQNINWSLRAVFCCCSECLGLVCGPLGRALQASIQPVDFENISRILRS